MENSQRSRLRFFIIIIIIIVAVVVVVITEYIVCSVPTAVGRVVNGAFMVLKGHRSIVNQVRFNPHTYMICSSGVEKVIKVRTHTHTQTITLAF